MTYWDIDQIQEFSLKIHDSNVCMGDTLRMSSFKTLSDFLYFWTPIKLLKMTSNMFYSEIRLTKLKVLPFLVGVCMGGNLRMSNLKILSM
jgi:hypothetical protein